MSSMEQLGLNLTLAEINTVLDALGQRPYAEVFQLIAKIKAQAEAQMRSGPSSTDFRPAPTEREQP